MDDPFKLLGLPARFDLDDADIESASVRLCAQLHPDRITGTDAEETVRKAAMANQAAATLMDPESRANILLRLHGGAAPDEDKSLPDGFLVEMMTMRQDMEQALQEPGDAARTRLQDEAAHRRHELIVELTSLFKAIEGVHGDAPREVLDQIRMTLNVLRYVERMIEQLDPDYTGLGDQARS